MTDRPYKLKGFTHHTPWVEDGKVFLCNDEDGEYLEEFSTREELEAFIEKLRSKADEAWDEYCEASLDLSDQEDVGEEQDEAQ